MEANILKQNGEIIISVEGRVDTTNAMEFENKIRPCFSETDSTIVLDGTDLSYISSSGLRVILMAYKQITSKGGKFVLRNLIPEVRSVIDMTGFSRIIPIE